MKPHLNENGELCRCGFGKLQDPYTLQPLQRTAGAKLDWIRERNDKFLQTEEGQIAFDWLERNVEAVSNLDPLAPWIWRELKKGRFENWAGNQLRHLADWYASNSPTRRGVDIMQLTDSDVRDLVRQWDQELASKMEGAETSKANTVAELGNGWTIQQITDAKQAKEEGEAMGHCVGTYGSQIQNGGIIVYSLRDPKNQPHATIEIDPGEETEYGYNQGELSEELRSLTKASDFVQKYITHPEELADVDTNEKTRNQVIQLIDHRLHGGLQRAPESFLLNKENSKLLENVIKLIKMKAEGKDVNSIVDNYRVKQLLKFDPSGHPVTQIQGKENKMPIPEYQEMIGNWLMSFDKPPWYERNVFHGYLGSPTNVSELIIWIDPEFDDSGSVYEMGEYEHEVMKDPYSWKDYFPEGQDHGYLHTQEGDSVYVWTREKINANKWKEIILDALQESYKPEQLAELVQNADKIDKKANYPALFQKAVEEVASDIIYPDFQQRLFYPESGISEARQWDNSPQGRYIDQLLGYNYVDPALSLAKIGPEQNQLFGPIAPTERQEGEIQRRIQIREEEGIEVPGETEEEKLRNVWNEIATEQWEKREPENIVPWQDPRNYDLQQGRFGNKIKNWFKRRRANILDPVSTQLDSMVWDNASAPRPTLKSEIADWVVNFITAALERNGYTDVDEWASFVVTGSLTTYQYSKHSDLDVSLFVNAERFPDWSRAEMIAIMMDECDGTTVPGTGHPLQCYVVPEGFNYDDLYKPGLRSAYDINESRWIVAPEKDRSHNVVNEMNEAYTIALENADKMEKLIRYEPIKAIQFYHQVHMRRRKDMLSGRGDFSPSNISYKMMEERGLFDQIKNLEEKYQV